MKTTPAKNLLIGAIVISLLMLALLTYTFLHESGHALVGLMFGGKITSFNVNFFNLAAHVGVYGSFIPSQQGWISSAGVGLPLLVLAVLLIILPKQGATVLEWFKLIAGMATINSLLAWIVVPILTFSGQVISDDSANFLRYTQLPPLFVSFLAVLTYLAGWVLLLNRVEG